MCNIFVINLFDTQDPKVRDLVMDLSRASQKAFDEASIWFEKLFSFQGQW